MAPERLRGAEADARADQYSLCAALYEALLGRLPASPEAIANHREGAAWPRPSKAGVPRRLRPILARGLDPDPEARFGSLDALAGVLEARRRSRVVRVVAGLGLLAAGLLWGQADADAGCPDAWEQLDATWNAERAQGVRAHFVEAAPSFGTDLAQVVVTALDRHAERWSSARSEVCRAADQSSGPASELPLRRACLDARLAALDALIVELERAPPAVLARAPAAVARWTIADCDDQRALLGVQPLPEAELTVLAIEAERESLARTSVQLALGRELEASEALRDAQPRIERLAYPPLSAEWALTRGSAFAGQGEHDAAEAWFHRALLESIAGRHEAVQAEAYVGLADLLLQRSGQRARGRQYLELADTLLARLEPGATHRRAELAWATHHKGVGRLDEALAATSAVLEDERLVATDERIAALNLRVAILGDLGRHVEAIAEARRAVSVAQTLGEQHPLVAAAQGELSLMLMVAGELDEALAAAQSALAIRREDVGGDPALLARAHNDVGAVAWRMGRMPEARASFEAALSSMDPESTAYGVTADNLGNVLMHLGEVESAEALHRDAIRSLRAAHGEAHFETALAHHNLGETLYRQQRYDAARDAYARALALNEAARGEDHPDNGAMLLGMGKCLMKSNRYGEAELVLARALSLRGGEGDDPFTRGVIRYALAVAVERGPGDVDRARRLVQGAVADFRATQAPAQADLERALDWIERHPEVDRP